MMLNLARPRPAEGRHHPARPRGLSGPALGVALGVALTGPATRSTAVAAVSDTSVQRARDHFPEARWPSLPG